MDTRFLESFVRVAEDGSMAGAARRLGLTPAAIAQRIRALEDEIGARLLVRSGRAVKPTEVGAAILERARDLLRDARDLTTIVAEDSLSGELRLGVLPSAFGGFLPEALKRTTQKHPKIAISIVPGIAPDLYRRVTRGELDAAVIVAPPFAIPKSCRWHGLAEEPLVLLTPQSMPMRNVRAILTQEPLIRPPRDGWGGRIVEAYLRKTNIRSRTRFELPGMAIAVLVDQGLGVAVVPDWLGRWPEGLSLRKTPLPGKSFVRRIGLIWARASVRSRLVQAFLDEATAVLKKNTSPRRSAS